MKGKMVRFSLLVAVSVKKGWWKVIEPEVLTISVG